MVEIQLRDDAEFVDVEAKADGIYVKVDVYDDNYRLLESHTYDVGPEADS